EGLSDPNQGAAGWARWHEKLPTVHGAQMAREMAEQPARLRELIERHDAIADRVRAMAPTELNGIVIAARGSSDHAAIYGRYLLEAAARRPVSLAAPSLHTLSRVEVGSSGQLVTAV